MPVTLRQLHFSDHLLELIVLRTHAFELSLDGIKRIANFVRYSRVQQSLHLLLDAVSLIDDFHRDISDLQHERVVNVVFEADVFSKLLTSLNHWSF